jgi:hypothetical protein
MQATFLSDATESVRNKWNPLKVVFSIQARQSRDCTF